MRKVIKCNKQNGRPVFESECLYKSGQIKENDKACLQCPFRNENPPQVARNTPKALADAYLDGKSILNDTLFQGLAHEVYGRRDRDGEGDSSIRVLGKLRLRPSVKDQIHTALADFLLSIYVTSKEVVKSRIKEYHKSRRGEHRLKKILDAPILSQKTKERIKGDLSRLEQYGKGKHTYSPINEVDYFLRLLRIEAYTIALKNLGDVAEFVHLFFPFRNPIHPHPFNSSGVRSCNHSLQKFFQPILRHFLKTAFNSSKSFVSRRYFWAAFKSSRDAIAGMVASKYRSSQGA